jgi:hypothetical protein
LISSPHTIFIIIWIEKVSCQLELDTITRKTVIDLSYFEEKQGAGLGTSHYRDLHVIMNTHILPARLIVPFVTSSRSGRQQDGRSVLTAAHFVLLPLTPNMTETRHP